MSSAELVPLTSLAAGRNGVVKEIRGGDQVSRRLKALGIRIGEEVTKVSGMFMQGPITIQIKRTQIAIGFGMASKIMLEVVK